MIVFFWWEIEGKEKGKMGFGSWERMRNLRALPLRYGKNLNRRRLRPSQFRKLYQSTSREGVEEEEEGGGGGRWENGLTTLLPCDSENLLSSLLFVFPFSLIFFFFFFFFLPLISGSSTKFLPFWLICHSSKNPPTKFSKQKPMVV